MDVEQARRETAAAVQAKKEAELRQRELAAAERNAVPTTPEFQLELSRLRDIVSMERKIRAAAARGETTTVLYSLFLGSRNYGRVENSRENWLRHLGLDCEGFARDSNSYRQSSWLFRAFAKPPTYEDYAHGALKEVTQHFQGLGYSVKFLWSQRNCRYERDGIEPHSFDSVFELHVSWTQ